MNGMFKDKNKRVNPSTHCCSLFFFQSRKKKTGLLVMNLQRLKSGGQTKKKKFIQKLVISSITSDKWID